MKTLVLHLFERLALVVRSGATISAGIYLFKVNNRNIRARCEICLKSAIKTPERCSYRNQSIDMQSKSMDWFLYGRRSGLFIVNFEHFSCFILVFLL